MTEWKDEIKDSFGWNNIKDEWPKPNTEVIVFYMIEDDGEAVSFFRSTIINEKCINNIKSPVIYWINLPS